MTGIAALLVAAAALVWIGQWVSLSALDPAAVTPLPPRLRSRLQWWAGHRAAVGVGCAAVVVGGLASGLLTG